MKNLFGEKESAKLDCVPLSNDTVRLRVKEMSVDITEQVISGVKNSKFGFAIQIDESTDVIKCSQLLVYVRFIQKYQEKTELLISKELDSTTKGKDVFNVLDFFF